MQSTFVRKTNGRPLEDDVSCELKLSMMSHGPTLKLKRWSANWIPVQNALGTLLAFTPIETKLGAIVVMGTVPVITWGELSLQIHAMASMPACLVKNYVVLAKVHVMVAKHATHLMVL